MVDWGHSSTTEHLLPTTLGESRASLRPSVLAHITRSTDYSSMLSPHSTRAETSKASMFSIFFSKRNFTVCTYAFIISFITCTILVFNPSLPSIPFGLKNLLHTSPQTPNSDWKRKSLPQTDEIGSLKGNVGIDQKGFQNGHDQSSGENGGMKKNGEIGTDNHIGIAQPPNTNKENAETERDNHIGTAQSSNTTKDNAETERDNLIGTAQTSNTTKENVETGRDHHIGTAQPSNTTKGNVETERDHHIPSNTTKGTVETERDHHIGTPQPSNTTKDNVEIPRDDHISTAQPSNTTKENVETERDHHIGTPQPSNTTNKGNVETGRDFGTPQTTNTTKENVEIARDDHIGTAQPSNTTKENAEIQKDRPIGTAQPSNTTKGNVETERDNHIGTAQPSNTTKENVEKVEGSEKRNETKNVVSSNSSSNEKEDTNKKGKQTRLELKNDCDLFDGTWVRDDSYPLYAAGTCPYIDEAFNCFPNGRPDNDYEKYRWQPKHCNVPRLDGRKMLRLLAGKRLVFVGDSLNRNMWESLLCVLRNSVEDKNKVNEVSGRKEFRTEKSYSFIFQDYNCSVEFFQSQFLVQEWEGKDKNGSKKETLRIDLMESAADNYKDADFLIFNTGHWWTHEKTSNGLGYYQEGDHVYDELNGEEAYRRALSTWGRWLDTKVDPKKTAVFFRGYSLSHFRGAAWNAGGKCDGETKPTTETEYGGEYPSYVKIFESVLEKMKTPILYLNITAMTDFRKDAHPSFYRKPNLTAEERQATSIQDCSHWCLPGVPETWNELLFAQLLRRHKQQKKKKQHI
ncbi:PREDICTED: protein trichome birefringence-like 1 isoform X1 [Fragaria vesca subsp. vesca]|uniref:protein trichome birefringence-like 1 isoform X1 n=1 Tax=Fragaria vesca subsp. vesca TaxID=101020 RepID=UPI0002C35E1A|nr:PREDICTED: protein trichome birefringence-like 1 isoform X1 [Fragaria vesca subsp. vesca]